MIAMIDVETTGLIAHKCHLLEVACIIVDEDYVEQERYHAVVRYSRQDAFDMRLIASKTVQKMHDATLLWDRITQDGAKPLSLIDTELANILSVAGMRPPAIGGNSVALDQSFVREHLPESYAELDYHMRDVSTIAAFAQESYGVPVFEKRQAHKAMDDIEDCIAELVYYRDTIRDVILLEQR